MDSSIDIKKLRDDRVLKNAGIAAATGVAKYGNLKLKEVKKEEQPKKEVKPVSKEPSKWAEESWERIKRQGIMDGTRPRDPVTRQELAKVIDNLLFNENQKSWFEDDIKEAIEKGITDGTNLGGIATREQVISMIIRALKEEL